MEDREIIEEFLIESNESLLRLEQEIVDLEQRPDDPELLGSIFRTVHSIKGACGFLGFVNLGNVAHIAENLLSQLRSHERELTSTLTSLILETVDAIKHELGSIESTSKESGATWSELIRRLTLTCNELNEAAETSPAVVEAVKPVSSPAEAVAAREVHGESDPGGAGRGGSISDSTIRVDIGLLDKLMNLVGELVLARNQILQHTSRQDEATLNGTAQRLNLITSQLQEGVMKTRMQPIGVIFNKLPRVVRDLAASCGKQIHLEVEGAETELDKSIIETIKDPLTHIVRNCCDHGIEGPDARRAKGKSPQGRLLLRAYHEGGQVIIEISDDGAGINGDRVRQKALDKGLVRPEQVERMSERETANLIFLPGLSTAETVTSISGRGVGMDVVKTNIEKIGGVVDLTTRLGEGTTVKIKIPLTLAIIPGLVVNSGGERFVIPQVSLLELLRLEGKSGQKQIERIHGTLVYRRRGHLLPIVYLNELVGIQKEAGDDEIVNIVVLQAEDRPFGLVVDAISDTQEIVVKPLGKQLKGLNAYAGATIMGDGKVALILDVLGIAQLSRVVGEAHDPINARGDASEAARSEQQTFLLFKAGGFERLAVPLSLVTRLEEFPLSRVERAGGALAVQYREQILQLSSLAAVLEPETAGVEQLSDPVQAIVFSDGGRMVGMVVDRILDICDANISSTKRSDRAGLSGSAVIEGKVTDFLDIAAVLRTMDESWGETGTETGRARSTVLVADGSAFTRGVVRNALELDGYEVREATDCAEALSRLEQHKVRVVVTSTVLPSQGKLRLVEEMHKRPEMARIPIVALGAGLQKGEGGEAFDVRLERFERSKLLDSVARLHRDVQEDAEAAEESLLVGGR